MEQCFVLFGMIHPTTAPSLSTSLLSRSILHPSLYLQKTRTPKSKMAPPPFCATLTENQPTTPQSQESSQYTQVTLRPPVRASRIVKAPTRQTIRTISQRLPDFSTEEELHQFLFNSEENLGANGISIILHLHKHQHWLSDDPETRYRKIPIMKIVHAIEANWERKNKVKRFDSMEERCEAFFAPAKEDEAQDGGEAV